MTAALRRFCHICQLPLWNELHNIFCESQKEGTNLMKSILIVGGLLAALMAGSGCTTKSYVRKQVEPIINHVNELDQLTAENTKQINGVDARLQRDLQSVNATAEQAGQKAAEAGTRAQQAQQTASTAETEAASLKEVANTLDTYHVVSQVAVRFAFDDCRLDSEAKQQLDEFSTQLSAAKNYVLVIEGRTDGAGSENYNNDLSERRADEVVRYMVAKHDLPPFKVHAIGLGEERPVAPNKSADGRRENRRVDVKLMSNATTSAQGSNTNQPTAENEVGRATVPKR
jgi:outer membrane protein OmpA-like peptidoglycan-associated protein